MEKSRANEEGIEASDTPEKNLSAPNISYFTLYRFASKWDKLLIAVSLLATVAAGMSLPYAITLVASVFQNMIAYAQAVQDGKDDSKLFLQNMHRFGVLYSCIGILLFVSGYLGSALMNLTAINQVFKIRQAYLRAALNQDFEYYDLYQTGDFASKMADDLIKLEEGIGEKVSAFTYNVAIGIGCLFMALIKGWKLALVCLTTTPVTLLLVGLTGKFANRLSKREAAESGEASAIAQEVLESIRTVYAFNGQQKEIDRYREPLAKARRINIRKGLSMGFLFLCVFSSYALSFYTGVYLIINDPDHYNADVMFSVFFGVMTAMGNFGMIGSLVGAFGSARGAGAQIFKLLDNEPKINLLLDAGIKPDTIDGNIELKNVVFRYPSRPDVPILNGVSLSVKRGQSVALVGHSGCGKSTIIQLISRFYDVNDGSVCVDGRDVRELSVEWLRAQLGLVGQEPVLFNASVRDNIRYGREDASSHDIQAAAQQANAHHFILSLPQGYDTLVGERGASLSGGQKQRIAIARALVRNPRILLLDEATSALDTSSEAKVQIALDKASKGRTTIVVAHRLSTIRNVDLIYVMKQGQVIESGTHDDLMAQKGRYYDMVMIQGPSNYDNSKVHHDPNREESKMSIVDVEETHIPDESSDDENKMKIPHVSFWRMVRLNAPEWKSITIGSLSSIIIGFAMPIFIVIFGDLFGSMSNPDPKQMMDKVKKVSIVCILIGVVMGLSNLLESVSFGIAGAYLTERLRVRMFSRLLQLPAAYYDDRSNSTGALCARLSSEAAYVKAATGQRIGVCLQGVGSIGLALLLALLFEWRVALVALAFLPLVTLVIYHQAQTTSQESIGNAKALECSTKIAMEAVGGARTVASLGRAAGLRREYGAALASALGAAQRAAHARGLAAGLARSVFNFINAAALTYGAHLIVSAGQAYENILVTTQSLQMASSQAQNAFTYAPDFQKGIKAASRIMVLLETKPKICNPDSPSIVGFKSQGEASFKDVSFSYPSRGVKVLQGLHLKIDRGRTVALVGRSGCGKSTVIQLLERYYDPDSGTVCLEEFPLPQLLMDEARASFGLVSQEPVLFARSIAENIAYGDNSRAPTLHEIIDAAKQANIHSFIITLPQGYETNIGAKGTQLSGGQKQRVAIARALIRQPKILLLDEATSALDTESEKVVQAALEGARAGRTCLSIAHRLSTVRAADVICVLSAGRLAEAGTHQDLLDAKGLYYNLHADTAPTTS